MDTLQITKIHNQVLEIYRSSLLPVVYKYFDNEENISKEKLSDEYPTTLVTQADLAINSVLFEKLPKLLTGSKVISEESADKTIAKYTFIIDPIDGTHTFAQNLDDFGISIVLCEDGIAIYSVIFFPNCKTEYYYAIKGCGAFDSQDKKVTPRMFFKFEPTLISAPSTRKIGRALIDLTKGRRLYFRVYGSAVYAGYTLFRGGTDFIVFDSLNIWDILGCVLIAKEAGLVVQWFGEEPRFDNSVDITQVKFTVAIYKPDFDTTLLDELLVSIKSTFDTPKGSIEDIQGGLSRRQ